MDNGKKKMKKKSKLKLAVDILMTLTLLFLMGYQLSLSYAPLWSMMTGSPLSWNLILTMERSA